MGAHRVIVSTCRVAVLLRVELRRGGADYTGTLAPLSGFWIHFEPEFSSEEEIESSEKFSLGPLCDILDFRGHQGHV